MDNKKLLDFYIFTITGLIAISYLFIAYKLQGGI